MLKSIIKFIVTTCAISAFIAGFLFYVGSYKTSEILPRVTISAVHSTPGPSFAKLYNKDQIQDIRTVRPKTVISSGDMQFTRDLNNNKNLVGESQNIFVGKIIREAKSNWSDTRFDVQIIKNIKGDLQGTVSVGITGGYRNGVFYVIGGSTYLRPGSTYLLATRYDPRNFYYLISYQTAWKLISQDPNLTDTQLFALTENDSRARQLESAYPSEALLPIDVAHNNISNSYQSLTEAQKYALPFYSGSYNPNPPAPTSSVQ